MLACLAANPDQPGGREAPGLAASFNRLLIVVD